MRSDKILSDCADRDIHCGYSLPTTNAPVMIHFTLDSNGLEFQNHFALRLNSNNRSTPVDIIVHFLNSVSAQYPL